MDVRERIGEPLAEAIEAAMDARQSQIFTALPIRIVSYDPDGENGPTAVVQPTVKATIRQSDGKLKRVDLPQLHDAPVHFPSGGGASLTFPLKEGDTGMAIFSSRSLDQFLQSGDNSQQVSARMHDLSDAVIWVGMRTRKNKIQNISKTAVQLRTDNGKGVISMDSETGVITKQVKNDAGKQTTMTVTATGVAFTMPAPEDGGTGLTVNGRKVDDTHLHTNVEPGGGVSGPPEV